MAYKLSQVLFNSLAKNGLRRNVQNVVCLSSIRQYSSKDSNPKLRKASTPIGRLDEKWGSKSEDMKPQKAAIDEDAVYEAFPDDKNPETGEIGGPKGPEPTRYGDWERKGRVIDF